MDCDICGSKKATEAMEVDPGVGIAVPVISCPDCELSYTDYRAEKIREEYHGVLICMGARTPGHRRWGLMSPIPAL